MYLYDLIYIYEVRQDFPRINSGIGRPALKSNVHRTNVRIPDVRLMCHSKPEKQQGGAIMAISLWVPNLRWFGFWPGNGLQEASRSRAVR